MSNIDKLTDMLLQNETVPAPEVTAVKVQVRTDGVVPLPTWLLPTDEDGDADPSVK